jgi:hypothetical protein
MGAPCRSCIFRLTCPESEDRTPPVTVAPVKKSRFKKCLKWLKDCWDGFVLGSVIIGICSIPFLMGIGISCLVPRDSSSFTEATTPSPTPFLASVPPRPKYIADK